MAAACQRSTYRLRSVKRAPCTRAGRVYSTRAGPNHFVSSESSHRIDCDRAIDPVNFRRGLRSRRELSWECVCFRKLVPGLRRDTRRTERAILHRSPTSPNGIGSSVRRAGSRRAQTDAGSFTDSLLASRQCVGTGSRKCRIAVRARLDAFQLGSLHRSARLAEFGSSRGDANQCAVSEVGLDELLAGSHGRRGGIMRKAALVAARGLGRRCSAWQLRCARRSEPAKAETCSSACCN